MAGDILDHHDGVIDQDTDGKDQREQGDAIEGIAVKIKDQEGQPQGCGHGQHGNDGFPPAQEQENNQGHAEDGKSHVQEQFIGFLRGRGPVVPGHRDLDVSRDQGTLQAVDLGQHGMYDLNGVGAGAFGH